MQDPASGRWLPVLLDGYVEQESSDGAVRRLMVEIDRGTLTIERFRRKLRAWELYAGDEPAARESTARAAVRQDGSGADASYGRREPRRLRPG